MRSDILSDLNVNHPLDVSGAEFNQATERYYRERLRASHLHDALTMLEADAAKMDGAGYVDESRPALDRALKGRSALACVRESGAGLINDDLDLAGITRLIHLQLAAIRHDALKCASN
jgi:hypothetical protein